jgi:D-glycero-alpha-D-manno-heptose-7-phosphate kinase
MNEIIRAKAPLRLGLAGGGTDVSPFSDEYGGHVLNATIDLYAQVILEPTNSGLVEFVAADRNERIVFNGSEYLTIDPTLPLHRGIYNRIVRDYNGGKPLSFKMTTYADAPAGSGLGTSSTMVVCILQAFAEWLHIGLGEYELAHLAYEIERIDLGLSGGKQDQYAAAFGGFNFIDFGPSDKVLVNPLRIKSPIINELEASTILFYTGQSRESSKIIEHQIANARDINSASHAAMVKLKNDAIAMKSALLRGDFVLYGEILKESWESKKKLSHSITSDELNAIYDVAIYAGATSGKLSGAGGGGFFMFFAPPQLRMSVINALKNVKGQIINFHFDMSGAQGWRNNFI